MHPSQGKRLCILLLEMLGLDLHFVSVIWPFVFHRLEPLPGRNATESVQEERSPKHPTSLFDLHPRGWRLEWLRGL